MLEFPIASIGANLGEKNGDIASRTLGHGTTSWPHKPPKCALTLVGTHVCSTSQELHLHLFVHSALWLPIIMT
jgi:hypothetical protein